MRPVADEVGAPRRERAALKRLPPHRHRTNFGAVLAALGSGRAGHAQSAPGRSTGVLRTRSTDSAWRRGTVTLRIAEGSVTSGSPRQPGAISYPKRERDEDGKARGFFASMRPYRVTTRRRARQVSPRRMRTE